MKKRRQLTRLGDLAEKVIPTDHSHQVGSTYYVDYLLAREDNINTSLDLGCGTGKSINMFRKKTPSIRWIGLDIVSYPEWRSRTETDGEFYTYDGVHIPFEDNYFDLIYCGQVLEHVRNPAELLKEVNRVLRPGGHFIGSTSQLQPYHAYSLWNYTPYGFSLLVEEAGLELIEIRPGMDGLMLIIYTGGVVPKFISSKFWDRDSPLNVIINIAGRIMQKRHADINRIKLLFCGQFNFLVTKPYGR